MSNKNISGKFSEKHQNNKIRDIIFQSDRKLKKLKGSKYETTDKSKVDKEFPICEFLCSPALNVPMSKKINNFISDVYRGKIDFYKNYN